jgi:hypothetical protein
MSCGSKNGVVAAVATLGLPLTSAQSEERFFDSELVAISWRTKYGQWAE